MTNMDMSGRLTRWALALFVASSATACSGGSSSDPGPRDAAAVDAADAGPGEFPCDVSAVLDAKCRRCHSDPPENGAPFSFTNADAFFPDTEILIRERMQVVIESDYMPYMEEEFDPPVEALTPAEKQVLTDWFANDFPVYSGTCE